MTLSWETTQGVSIIYVLPKGRTASVMSEWAPASKQIFWQVWLQFVDFVSYIWRTYNSNILSIVL